MDRHRKNWPHMCAECGEPFLGIKKAKFCSRKCSCHAAAAASEKAAAVKEAKRVDARRRERVRKIDEKLAMSRRMYARDREFAEKFPHLATGAVRGTVPFFPNVSKPTCAMPVDMRLFRATEVPARRWREAKARGNK